MHYVVHIVVVRVGIVFRCAKVGTLSFVSKLFPFWKVFCGAWIVHALWIAYALKVDACLCASLCRFLGGYIVDERVDESLISYFGFAMWLALSVCGLPE